MATSELIAKLIKATSTVRYSKKPADIVAAWDYFARLVQQKPAQLGPEGRTLLMQFLSDPDRLETRKMAIQAQFKAATTQPMCQEALANIGLMRSTLLPDNLLDALDAMQASLQKRLAVNAIVQAPQKNAALQLPSPARSSEGSSYNSSDSSSNSADSYLKGAAEQKRAWEFNNAQLAPLLQEPAEKIKLVSKAAEDNALRDSSHASYLVSKNDPSKVYRIGKTLIAGSFSKIRDYVDETGHAGKMRVVHLHPQAKRGGKRSVKPTPYADILAEQAAMKKAGSKLAYEHIFSVSSKELHGATKLYIPLVDAGIDGIYFRLGTSEPLPAAYKAAAMREFIGALNTPLLGLHSNEGSAAMVHRDIKAENVLIDKNGVVSLIDYGLAIQASKLEPGTAAGTAGYIAPEYFVNHLFARDFAAWPLDARIDIWSVATTTLDLFFGDQFLDLGFQELAEKGFGRVHALNLEQAMLQEDWQANEDGSDWTPAMQRQQDRVRQSTLSRAQAMELRAGAFTTLDNMRAEVKAADPAMASWFFKKFYRANPAERFTSIELDRALKSLPNFFGSKEADAAAAAAYWKAAWPTAVALQEQEKAGMTAYHVENFNSVEGLSLDALKKLSPTPKGATTAALEA